MLDNTLSASLDASAIRVFVAVQIRLPTSTINLIDGSGTVTFNVGGSPVTFTGQDPVFGTLGYLGSVSEQIAQESPSFSVGLYPPSETAAGELCQPENQGSKVLVWFGTVNDATGAPIGTPELLWSGRYDTAKFSSGENQHSVEIDTVSAFDRLFAAEENIRLNGTWHKSVWPDETGLDFVIAGLENPFWGVEGASSTTVTPTRRGFGGVRIPQR